MRRRFTEHPASVGETYFQHMESAFGFAAAMLGAGLACVVHGFFPWMFKTTGSRTVASLHDRMIHHRARYAGGMRTAPPPR